jgi:hypothetical protein
MQMPVNQVDFFDSKKSLAIPKVNPVGVWSGGFVFLVKYFWGWFGAEELI